MRNPMESSNIKGKEVAKKREEKSTERRVRKKLKIKEQKKRKQSGKNGREKTW